MKIYTRTGDKGTTQLYGGTRVAKDNLRVEAYGTVDEAIASLGCVVAIAEASEREKMLKRIMNRLFALNAALASPKKLPANVKGIEQKDIDEVEQWIDQVENGLEPLRQFILPTGTEAASRLHIARAVMRRAERRMTALHAVEPQDPILLAYVNRLSDFLFVLAREANKDAGGDVPASFDA